MIKIKKNIKLKSFAIFIYLIKVYDQNYDIPRAVNHF